MSFIRATSNPEGLYVYEGATTKEVYIESMGWHIPVGVFNSVMKTYTEKIVLLELDGGGVEYSGFEIRIRPGLRHELRWNAEQLPLWPVTFDAMYRGWKAWQDEKEVADG